MRWLLFLFIPAFLGAQDTYPVQRGREDIKQILERILDGRQKLHPVPVAPFREEVEKVLRLVQEHSPVPLENKSLRDSALKGMLGAVSPYDELLDPILEKKFSESVQGSYVGIGAVTWKEKDKPLQIRFPIPDSPAKKAGLRSGDLVIKIESDGRIIDTDPLSADEATALLRGAAGTAVILHVLRAGGPAGAAPERITVIRGRVRKPVVHARMLEPGIGYIHLESFDWESAEDFKKALNFLASSGILKANSALIIDLRDNSGGSLRVCQAIASHFLPYATPVVIMVTPHGHTIHSALWEGAYQNLKIAVLMNEYSASASEILAGALQDHKKAVLVGSRSLGKGSVQDIRRNFPDPGYLTKITIAKFLLPSGRSPIRDRDGGVGLKPDIAVDVPVSIERQLAQERFYRLMEQEPPTKIADPTLEKAIAYLKKK